MKATRFAVVVFGMLLGCANLAHAQASTGNSAQSSTCNSPAAISAPDLSKLNVSTVLKEMQSATAQDEPDESSPLQIVVQFLQLQPAQEPVFGQLLQARQTAVTPLFQGIAQREQQLEALLASGGNPAQVGILVIQIHALQQQVMQTQQVFLANLANLLDQEQQQRLAAVALAAQLQPVLPAFVALQLF
jgi:hypothetical protein